MCIGGLKDLTTRAFAGHPRTYNFGYFYTSEKEHLTNHLKYNILQSMANYNYTIGISVDKFGQASVGRSFSHTEPITLSTNDTITITFGSSTEAQSGTSEWVFSVSSGGDSFSGTKTGMSASNDPYVLTYTGDFGTSGNNASITLSATRSSPFGTGGGTLAIWRNTGDSTPTIGRQSVSTSSTSTATETTYTVTGLGSGKKCGFAATSYSNYGNNARVKKGSGGTYAQTATDFSNNDVLYMIANSPDTKGVTSVSQFYSFDGRGSSTPDQTFELDVTVNEDTDSVYGMEFFDSSGDLLLSVNDRSSRFVTKGSYTETIAANSQSTKTISLSGMDTSDKWIINAHVDLASVNTTKFISVRSIVQETNQFKITTYNGDSSSRSVTTEYYVLITG